jgi:hypothetical protein
MDDADRVCFADKCDRTMVTITSLCPTAAPRKVALGDQPVDDEQAETLVTC